MTLSACCEDLSIGWPGRVLLEGLAADIRFADINYTLPIVGRTGRGKSTLLYALSGMAQPLAGGITWMLPDRSDSSTKRAHQAEAVRWSAQTSSFKSINHLRRRSFGFLLQDAPMIPCFTVAENLRHALHLRNIRDRTEERIKASIEKMLIEGETVGHFYNRYPMHLSGGMRQRMALAMAIAHDPQVLFADEPTASLDDATGMDVLRVVRRWLDEEAGRRAFVFVTHRVETLREGAGACEVLRLQKDIAGSAERVVARLESLH